jgi:hypothetical protein
MFFFCQQEITSKSGFCLKMLNLVIFNSIRCFEKNSFPAKSSLCNPFLLVLITFLTFSFFPALCSGFFQKLAILSFNNTPIKLFFSAH